MATMRNRREVPRYILFPTPKRRSSSEEEPPLIIAASPNSKLYRNPLYDEHNVLLHDEDDLTLDMDSSDSARYQRRIKALEDQQARDLLLVSTLRSELHLTRTKIAKLKGAAGRAECENERTVSELKEATKRVEGEMQRVRTALQKQRTARVTSERARVELAMELEKDRARMEEMARKCEKVREEVEEERRTMRIAVAWREERLQMKLDDAQRFLEKRMSDLHLADGKKKAVELLTLPPPMRTPTSSNDGGSKGWNKQQGMVENPHIQRGIKGFVEFSRVLKLGTMKGRNVCSSKANDQCQKDLLLRRYFRKQRIPVVPSTENSIPG